MKRYTCYKCGAVSPEIEFPNRYNRLRSVCAGWRCTDNAAGVVCPACNPYNRLPLRTIWQKGWQACRDGLEDKGPYTNYSDHGGTWGTRANRVWRDGYAACEQSAQICEYCAGAVFSDDESCDVCGGHLDCCSGHDNEVG